MLCSPDLLVGCTGGVLAAGAKPRSLIPFADTVTEQTVSGVGRQTHATAGQEAGATNSLTRLVRNADQNSHSNPWVLASPYRICHVVCGQIHDEANR